MKAVALASLLLALAGPAAAQFTGSLAPPDWTVANTGTLTGGSPTLGTAAFTPPTQLVLTGSDSVSPAGPGGFAPSCSGGFFQTLGPCQLQVTANVPGTYAFSWSYLTSDQAGPGGDLFGAIVDGTRIQLSDSGGLNSQSGTRTFSAGSSFGWFINCGDCIDGSATATISQFAFAAAVPEPETYALMLVGALGVLVRVQRRWRRRANA